MRVFLPILVALLFLSIAFGGVAYAQKCDAAYETITSLYSPVTGSYNQWDAVYGFDGSMVEFASGVVNSLNNTVVVGGRSYNDGSAPALLLVEFDYRGRVVMERAHKIKGLEKIHKVLLLRDGYLVVADQKSGKDGHQVWLGFFDMQGDLSRAAVIDNSERDLFVGDFIGTEKGDGYVLAAFAKARTASPIGETMIYRLDNKGKVLSHKTYLPGVESMPFNVSEQPSGRYLISGYVRTENGSKAGWILNLESDGRVVWHQQYARGLFSQITKAEGYLDKYIVAVGDAEPVDRKNKAGWVMVLNEGDGSIGWQRYYKGRYDFHGRDLIIHDDGRLSVLLDAQAPPKSDKENYARVLMLSPRGVILQSNSYYNGKGASANEFFIGPNKEPIVVGGSRVAHASEHDNVPDGGQVIIGHEGWAVSGAPIGKYTDPCVESLDFIE